MTPAELEGQDARWNGSRAAGGTPVGWSCRVSLRVRTPLMHPQRGVRRDLPVGLPVKVGLNRADIGLSRYCQWFHYASSIRRSQTTDRTTHETHTENAAAWYATALDAARRAAVRRWTRSTEAAAHHHGVRGIPCRLGYRAAWDSACKEERTGGDTWHRRGGLHTAWARAGAGTRGVNAGGMSFATSRHVACCM